MCTAPHPLAGAGKWGSEISSGETHQQRPPESGQRVGSEQALRSEQTDLQVSNSAKARTFKTLPKAELKDVQGEAAGAFSWIRIWSFSSLEGVQGPKIRASVSSDPQPLYPVREEEGRRPSSSLLPQGDAGERKKSSGSGHGEAFLLQPELPARAVAPGLTEAARGKAGECRQWGLLLAGGSLQRAAPPSERDQHQDMRGSSTEEARNEGSFWGKMGGLPNVIFPP